MIPLEANKTYHIFNHANGFESLFISEENKRFFMERYAAHIAPIADTYAYCLMNNHFHLLLKIKGEEEVVNHMTSKVQNFESHAGVENKIEYFVSRQFANFFSSYTQAFNKMYGRMGSLFMKNFKREEITTEEHFRALVAYIHRNSVHHRFCNQYSDWKFSSYNSFVSSTNDNDNISLDTEFVFQAFGSMEAFGAVHAEKLEQFHFSTALDMSYKL